MKSIIIFWLFTLICVSSGYGQGLAGINTITPQQQLQVSGTTDNPGTQIGTSGIYVVKPTLRIDGLNKTNNAANGVYALPPLLTVAPYSTVPYSWSSSPSALPVSVTQDGDLLLSRDYVIPLVATQLGTDALTTPTTITSLITPTGTSTSMEGTLTGGTGYTFTINQSCMVHFLASVSVSIYAGGGATAKTLVTDSKPKTYHAFFRFLSVPSGSTLVTGTATNNQFGYDGNSYTNTSSTGVSGDMYVNPEAYLVLQPGTYTVDLVGRVFGYSYGFDGVFGGGTEDMLSIIATPLN